MKKVDCQIFSRFMEGINDVVEDLDECSLEEIERLRLQMVSLVNTNIERYRIRRIHQQK